jgi:hypothetical protein
MTKKVSIGVRPSTKPAAPAADAWVENRADATEATKRLTIDIPDSLHRTIKAQCAMRGSKIADEVRELLLQKYGKQ